MRHSGLSAVTVCLLAFVMHGIPDARAAQTNATHQPTFDWSGLYLGAFGAWDSADINASPLFTESFGGNYYNQPPGSYGFDDEAFSGGLQTGFDWQWNRLLFGIGGEIGRLKFERSVEDPNFLPTPFPDGSAVTTFESDWYGALTGRAGYAFDRVLLYGRGGVAFLDANATTIDTCVDDACGVLTIEAKGDDVLTGWTLGGGVEVAVARHLAVGGEYRHFDFEDLKVEGEASNFLVYSQHLDVTSDEVRGFISFHW